jgi:hypothetical protein
VLLALSQVERMMSICRRISACIVDPHDPSRVIDREDIRAGASRQVEAIRMRVTSNFIRARNAVQGERLRLRDLYGFGPHWPAFSLIVRIAAKDHLYPKAKSL